jgi:hypothetical protein
MSAGRHRLPEPIGEAVQRELARAGSWPAATALGGLVDRWPEAVGAAIARNAWPARMARDGTVVVHTASSVWAHELTQLEATIREQLGDVAPPTLRFAPGPLPAPSAESEKPLQKDAPEPSAEERALAQRLASEIEDPSLREAVSRAAALSLAAAVSRGGSAGSSDTLTDA